ncbi:hypothetical protein D3C73_973170 [compost metagenome]
MRIVLGNDRNVRLKIINYLFDKRKHLKLAFYGIGQNILFTDNKQLVRYALHYLKIVGLLLCFQVFIKACNTQRGSYNLTLMSKARKPLHQNPVRFMRSAPRVQIFH